MWNEVADEVDARGSQSHFYRLPDEFSSVPSDCSSDLKVQNLIADQVEGKLMLCLFPSFVMIELVYQRDANG